MAAKYIDIAADLQKRISDGEFPAGSTLPRYTDLCEQYGVGQGSIRGAVRRLEETGAVMAVKRRGMVVRELSGRRCVTRGHLVTRDPNRGYVMPAAASADEPWQIHGRPRVDRATPPERVRELLNLGAESGSILRRRRVTSPEGEAPFQLVVTWIHPDAEADAPRVADKNTGPGGYLDRLEEAGHGPIAWTEFLRTRMPLNPEETRALDIPAALPVLEIARVGSSGATGRPVEVTIVVIPGDRVEISTRLRRARSATWTE